MRVVLDTNVLISAFISRNGLPFQALKFWLNGDYELVTSQWQIEEFKNTSLKPKVQQKLSRSAVGTFVNALLGNAIIVDKLPKIDVSPDPDDNYIIATAIAGEAQYLVSGDKGDLLYLEKIQGIRILSVRTFVNLLTI